MKKVMVIEDDTRNLDVLTRFLLRSSFEVLAPHNADETLKMATEQSPDVILMDLKLNNWVPESNGFDLTEALRSVPELSTVPIIALSAHTFDHDIDRAMQAGCSEFVEKPIDFIRLMERLKEITGE